MPNCRYIILNYHSAETLEKGEPLVLLLEYIETDGSRQRRSYLLSDLAHVVANTSPQIREWLISALTDISEEEFNLGSDQDGLFGRFSSLNIGPLRTARAESLDCSSLSEAFELINREGCWAKILLPLDRKALGSIGTGVEPLSTESAAFKTEKAV
jgi:hypothetical protein